jgi:chorismate synthase
MPIVVRGVMKPIPTLYKPLQSVDIESKEPFQASIERSDSCAVPAASVVAEAVVAWEVASALVEQFGQDRLGLIKENVQRMRVHAAEF